MFLCQKWLADDEGDQLIERDLYESEDMRLKRRPSMIIVIFKERFCFSINSNTCLLLLIFEYVHVQDNFFWPRKRETVIGREITIAVCFE